MKKISVILATALLAVLPAKAQKVTEDNFLHLNVHFSTPDLQVNTIAVDGTNYTLITIDGYTLGGEIGSPALPQLTSLLTIPFCKDIQVSVENALYDTIPFIIHHSSFITNFFPLQPSRSKSDTVHHAVVLNPQAYNTDRYIGQPLASVTPLGIARDRRLANLTFSPVAVNPLSHSVVICRSADITLRYIGSDEQLTRSHFRRYFTPAYSVGNTLNQLIPSKDLTLSSPLRMVLLAHSSLRCKKLDEFVAWKRLQGLRVDLYYVDEMGLTTPAAIAETTAALYNNATETDPAPAFLLIVGDIQQVPAHDSRLQDNSSWWGSGTYDHVSDLYYTTWTSPDLIPDCYCGRFSVTDTASLAHVIDKTLLYEQYSFPDDSYLARAALIAGVDGGYSSDNAYKYADPAMDYIAKYYLNHTTGYDTVLYFKNDTSIHPHPNIVVAGSCKANNTPSILKDFYNQGAGWINYSAHGDWDCWYRPSFTVSDVNNMTNNQMPSFIIGNCCLSSQFDKPTCFGEALLRKGGNAGAVGYVGGSNSTYWAEDFYWAVGVRNNIRGNMNASYNPSNLGAYDRLFHTHGEDPSSATILTAGQIVFAGNLSVQSSSSSLKEYYWEIYHLFGDPSLIPWLGRASQPYATLHRGSHYSISTIPHAYVAIVGPQLLAGFADADGQLQLPVPQDDLSLYTLSVTAQSYKPLLRNLSQASSPSIQHSSFNIQIYPNPATDILTVDGLPENSSLQLLDPIGRTLSSFTTHHSSFKIDVSSLTPGLYILRIQTPSGTVVKKIVR